MRFCPDLLCETKANETKYPTWARRSDEEERERGFIKKRKEER
jgi:hypothetical protein